jgi:hypothetical protein
VVFRPSAGAVIATTGATPRVTVTAALLLPKGFVQATVIVFAPSASETGLAVALEVLDPPTVQVVPPGIDAAPSTVKETLTDEAVVFRPSAGAVIATAGGFPRKTITDWVSSPRALEHATSIVFDPSASAKVFMPALFVGAPLTVHVVPIGIDATPSTLKVTLTLDAVVFRPLPGAVIATDGPVPRTTVTVSASVPNALEQVTVIVFDPIARATPLVVVLVVATLFTLHVVPPGIDATPFNENATFTLAVDVTVLSTGTTIATTGATPRVTVTEALLPPKGFVQATVIELAPSESATLFKLVLADADPLTVQLVPTGIDEPPSIV